MSRPGFYASSDLDVPRTVNYPADDGRVMNEIELVGIDVLVQNSIVNGQPNSLEDLLSNPRLDLDACQGSRRTSGMGR